MADKIIDDELKPEDKPRRGRPKKISLDEKPKRGRPKKISAEVKPKRERKKLDYKSDGKEKIFALDIGTRSVIGIVAEQDDDGQMKIIATHRLEHTSRAMLDGQIHDVPQVAE
ncbi:MAG: cell division protein, partial [Selenomonadaceae bacterium]|nr:cell division protein [Selenomonadaceae bacterium]